MNAAPQRWTDADALAAEIIDAVQGRVVLAIPLGLGKPVQLTNALFERVRADKSASLKIYTALTLEKPSPKSLIERRFLEPLSERLFEGYTDLSYAKALRAGDLPENIEVNEFFLTAGRWLGVKKVQQNYISANYTDACAVTLNAGINVVAQLVALPPGADSGETARHYSLSCNPDISLDLLRARRNQKADFIFVGQANKELPFMGGDAAIEAKTFDHLLGGDCVGSTLYNTPKRPVTLSNYAAGFHAARLIPDDGTLQIGIGSLGDAIAHALIMRHKNNEDYRRIIDDLAPDTPPPSPCDDRPFDAGLYGCSEMLVDTFLDLIEAGVVAREVDGALVHGAFFLGPKTFYKRLSELTPEMREKIAMTSVLFVNDAHRDFAQKENDRRNARFINNAMKATLLGAVVSDGLDNGQVVSGVGGQFDFIMQAFALKDARSIIMIDAVRDGKDGPESNIVWSYGHVTAPRQFRDIVVSEYGVADLRGISDAATIEAMLSIADARFQEELVKAAIDAGKLPKDFSPPEAWRRNTPDHIQKVMCAARDEGLTPAFPFGSDFTEVEKDLVAALARLKKARGSIKALGALAVKGGVKGRPDNRETEALKRMELDKPDGAKEKFYRYLLRGALDLG